MGRLSLFCPLTQLSCGVAMVRLREDGLLWNGDHVAAGADDQPGILSDSGTVEHGHFDDLCSRKRCGKVNQRVGDAVRG